MDLIASDLQALCGEISFPHKPRNSPESSSKENGFYDRNFLRNKLELLCAECLKRANETSHLGY